MKLYDYNVVKKEHPIMALELKDVVGECHTPSLLPQWDKKFFKSNLCENSNLIESIIIACKTKNGYKRTNMTTYPLLLNHISLLGLSETKRRFNISTEFLEIGFKFIKNELHINIIE